MKLIVSCFSCSPTRGSEPGMGWGYLRAIAQEHDVWALVDGWEFGEELRKYQAEHPEELRRVHFIFVPCKPHPLLRRIWPPSYYWFYNLWHRRAFKIAQKLHEEIHFDAAWKLSMVTYREPGYLWKLPIPFIWGPVGALGYTDFRLIPLMGLSGAEYVVRNLINCIHSHVKFSSRKAARKAAATKTLIAATAENQVAMEKLWGVDSTILSEIGIEEVRGFCEPRKEARPLRIAWSGQFTAGKALNVLIRAVAKLKECEVRVDVLGEGRKKVAWQNLAKRLGVEASFTWHGWLERKEAIGIIEKADFFVISSMRDLTSSVLIEALSRGKPVVCIDHCGFSNVVDETCGIKVPVSWHVIDDFARAIKRLGDESLRRSFSAGALRKAQQYLWTVKRAVILGIIAKAKR